MFTKQLSQQCLLAFSVHSASTVLFGICKRAATPTSCHSRKATTMKYIAEIESSVAGIPCVIGVTEYQKGDRRADSDHDFYGYSEWFVCDHRGRTASWLESKLTNAEQSRIESEITEHFN